MNIFLYSRYRRIYKTDNSLLYIIYKKQNIYITDYFTPLDIKKATNCVVNHKK